MKLDIMRHRDKMNIGHIIATIAITSGAYLAAQNSMAWPWFLAAGTLLAFTSIGADIRKNESDKKQQQKN